MTSYYLISTDDSSAVDVGHPPLTQHSRRGARLVMPACSRLLFAAAAGVWQVGDYVLSPDIVVERKALADLFASLGSGRLYNQVRLHRLHSHPQPTHLAGRCINLESSTPWETDPNS